MVEPRRLRRSTSTLLLAMLASMTIAPASAQDSSPEAGGGASAAIGNDSDTPRTVDEEVIVRGQRLSEIEFDLRLYIRNFVNEVAAPARSRGYARWQRNVCIGVYNLQRTISQYIVDRISSLALNLGLEPGEPGCEAQVQIIFSTDGKQTASLMVKEAPRAFRPIGGYAGMDLGLEALDTFVESDNPVRWWHVSLPVDARTGATAVRIPGFDAPWIAVSGPSRLHSGVRDDLKHIMIVVDTTKLTGTTWQQIADYLAFVSLAQVDPNTDPSEFDTILNLFTNPAAYSGLTDWDESYLDALYSFNQERAASLQRNEIVNDIAARELGEDDDKGRRRGNRSSSSDR